MGANRAADSVSGLGNRRVVDDNAARLWTESRSDGRFVPPGFGTRGVVREDNNKFSSHHPFFRAFFRNFVILLHGDLCHPSEHDQEEPDRKHGSSRVRRTHAKRNRRRRRVSARGTRAKMERAHHRRKNTHARRRIASSPNYDFRAFRLALEGTAFPRQSRP